jgi:tripartite-type tricarboxylate transporter receptor subunit TctC
VPYKGGAFVINDLLSGEIQFAFQGQSNTVPLIKAKRLKALAIASAKRSTLLPDVPTLRETVMPKFELSTWIGVMAPAKTPGAIVKRLNSEIAAALQDPEMKARVEQEGADLRGSSPEDYGAYVKSELERWSKVVSANAIKPE